MSARKTGSQLLATVMDGVAFVCELAMLVILAVTGWRFASVLALQVVLAVALPSLAALVWSVWMAPQSPRRLDNPSRVATQVALFVLVAILAAGAGIGWAGLIFLIVSVLVFWSRSRLPG